MIYLIVGRFGSGKRTLANELTKKGLPVLAPHSAKPQHGDDSARKKLIGSLTFANEQPANGCKYTITKEFIESVNHEVIIIEPESIKPLADAFPDTSFYIIYIKAMTDDCRKRGVLENGHTSVTEQIYEDIIASESAAFSAFEEKLLDPPASFGGNIRCIHQIDNDYDSQTLHAHAMAFIRYKKQFENIVTIIGQCIKLGIIESDDNGRPCVSIADESTGNSIKESIPHEYLADTILANNDIFERVMYSWLSNNLQLEKAFHKEG